MHQLNKEFDKVICINLAERPDKREKMQKKFDDLGIEVEWFTAVQYGFIPKIIGPILSARVGHFNKSQPFEIGAALSHYTVIKQSLLRGYNKVLVFEDDVRFHKDFNDKLDSYLDVLNDIPEWDMLMFYSFMYHILPENERMHKRWVRSFRAWSLMAYGIKRGLMEKYIERQDQFFTISDAVTFKIQEEKKFNIYSAVPALCIPETNLGSNIRGQNMNYEYTPSVFNLGYGEEHYE